MTDATFADYILGVIPTAGEFAACFFTALFSYIVGWMLTSNANTALWLKLEMFDIRPFSCPVCMNFWVTILNFIILAYSANPMFLLWGVIAAAMTTYCVHDKWSE